MSPRNGAVNPKREEAIMAEQQGVDAPAETAEQSQANTETEAPAEKDLAAEVEKWKAMSRKNEEQAKANAAAAKRLAELEDANKSEAERQAEAVASLQRERDDALAEAARLRAAVTHGLTDEDLDLLGSGTPDEISERAERLARRLAAQGQPRKPAPDATQGAQADPNTSTAAQFAATIQGL